VGRNRWRKPLAKTIVASEITQSVRLRQAMQFPRGAPADHQTCERIKEMQAQPRRSLAATLVRHLRPPRQSRCGCFLRADLRVRAGGAANRRSASRLHLRVLELRSSEDPRAPGSGAEFLLLDCGQRVGWVIGIASRLAATSSSRGCADAGRVAQRSERLGCRRRSTERAGMSRLSHGELSALPRRSAQKYG